MSSHLEVQVSAVADLVFSVAVHAEYADLDETLAFAVDGVPVAAEEVHDSAGSRLHRIRQAPVGLLTLDYRATVRGRAPEAEASGFDQVLFTRPSRYCDSDRLVNIGHTHFPGLSGYELMAAVAQWVRTRVAYVPGSSRVVDGALDTYLSRKGVCRDSAHLVVTFLRGFNMPARVASVYAPGLQPMDFHAVAEAFWEGRWWVLDATGLAPREPMVRINTGRDASDTAFMTTLAGRTKLVRMQVTATVDGDLPVDDPTAFVTMG